MTASEYLDQHPDDYDPDVWSDLIVYEQTSRAVAVREEDQ